MAAQDVTYQIKALGSLEAEEIVQVTAEVEGAVTAVRFHEGDRVGPQTVLAPIDPERYRLEARARGGGLQAGAGRRGRARGRPARREQLAQEQLVAAEELNRSRGEAERLRGGGGFGQGRLRHRRCRTCSRVRGAAAPRRRDQHARRWRPASS